MRYLSTNFPAQYAAGCLLLFLMPVQQGCDENKNKGAKKEYLVKGILKGAENKKVFLEDRAFYHDEHPSDSVIADKSGQFSFNGSLKEPTFYMIRVNNVNAPVEFILENSRIDITGNTDSLWTAKVTGSKENDIHKELVPFTGYYDNEDQFNKIEIEYDSAKKAGDGSALTRMKEKKKALQERFGSKVLGFIRKYPTSVISVNALIYFGDDNLNVQDSLLKTFESSDIANHGQVKYFRKQIDAKKHLLPGQPAPQFTQNDVLERPVSLVSFKKNWVLIDFWASWCGPCRKENPNLVKVYNNYKSKNFTILSVSLDDKKENWLKAIQKDNLSDWTHVSDLKGWKNEVVSLYGVDAIPINYLVDPEGRIVARNLRGEELAIFLKQVIQ